MASKLKGKDWYEITAPKFFGDFIIGETLALEQEQLSGRVIETSLTDITGDPNKYYLKFYFKIDDVKDKKATTKFVGHDCTKDFLSRIVSRRKTRIDTNDVIKLQDNTIRVKSIAISNRRVSHPVEIKVRRIVREMIIQEVEKLKTEEFIREVIDGKLQMKIKKSVSKVYPLRFFEFRKTEVM
ncbi:MAG: 30S ribosomal protein S3ae [Candidatus Aenigmarchaeota archaeon]|nr:30S ribosomal protein S3ae [Candidatus Aenigmarchaeota archaeon]